jgi:glycosyltransferase involved in cell wall biosynthesis
VTFANGDADALAAALQRLLSQPNEIDRLTAPALAHLADFQPRRIAQHYLELFSTLAP